MYCFTIRLDLYMDPERDLDSTLNATWYDATWIGTLSGARQFPPGPPSSPVQKYRYVRTT